MSVNEKMTAIADAIRAKTGGTELLTLDDMATDIPKVFDAGKQAEQTAFWETIQKGGALNNYQYRFAFGSYTDNNYFPIYPIRGRGMLGIFVEAPITDTKVPIILESTSSNADFTQGFRYCTRLKTVVEFCPDEKTVLTSAFDNCSALENINVTGTIGKAVSFSSCIKLMHESLMSIINALKDYSDSGATYTLTLGTTNLAKLTDEEKALATQKGWTLA